MKETKIFTLLRSLSPKEWHKFVQFVLSNYPNQLILCKTIKILKPLYPKFAVDKNTLFMALFPDKEINLLKLNDALYRLTKVAEFYIGSIKDQKRNIDSINLLNHYKESKLGNIYSSKLKIIRSKNQPSHRDNFELEFLFEQNKMQQIEFLGDRNKDPNLQAVHDSLDKKYLYEKLKMSCVANNYTNMNGNIYDFGLLKTFFDSLDEKIKKEDGMIYLFLHSCLFQMKDNEGDFDKVLHFLTTEKITRSEDVSMIFSMCVNYCIRKINKGEKVYFSTLLSIYKLQINTACIYNDDGFISPFSMKNILTTAIRENDFEWAEKFVLSHFDKLAPLNREENYNYFLARIYYEKNEYKKCIRLLLQTEAIDFLNNLSIRVLQAKAFYSLDDYDGLDNVLHNFRLFLLRHKNKGYHYTFHVNFIKILKKIINLPASSKKAKEEIHAHISKLNNIAERAWLQGILTS